MTSNYNNPINILDTKNATGLGSGGSLNVEGGASIKQDTFIGGSLNVSGTSTAFSDNIMILNKNPISTKDTGILFERYNYVNDNKYSSLVYSETSDEFIFGYANSDNSGTGITFGNYIPIRANQLLLMSTENSIGLGSGGSLTVLGGASISKTLNVSNLSVISGSNTTLITTSGNVGIGTSAPSKSLDIIGDINLTGDYYQNGVLYTPGSQWSRFSNNISYTRGNVGINTTSPNTTFDVNGTANFSSSITTSSVNATNLVSSPSYTGGSMNLSGDLIVGGSVVTVNVTTTNVKDINISTGTLNVSNIAYITNATIPNQISTNVSSGTLNLSTGLTSASAQITNAAVTTSTIATLLNTNAVSTNVSSGTLNLSSGLTAASAQITNAAVTTSTIATLRNTNTISTNISSATLTLSTGLTSANVVATNLSSGTVSATTFTGGSLSLSGNLSVAGTSTIATLLNTNAVSTNVSSGTLNLSTGLTSASAQITNLNATTATVATLLNTNAVSTNVSSGTLNLSTGLTSASAQITNLNATTATVSTLLNTNAVSTNVSSGTLNLSSGLTAASAQITNAAVTTSTIATLINTNTISTNISSATLTLSTGLTSTNVVATNLSSGTVSATTFTGGSLSLSGNLSVAGTLTTVNITSTNLVNTNVSAGVVVASTSLSATGSSNTIANIFTNSGNVGVDTTSPAYKLDVNGPTRINTTRGVLIGSSTDLDATRLISALDSGMPGNSDRYIAFGKAASNNNQAELAFSNVTTGSSSNYLGLGIYGSRTMAINGAGNVGIGTTAPGYKLDVMGTARITTSVTTGALYSTNQTSTNIVGTNISAGTLLNTNQISTNVSSGTLNLSTGLTSASAKISNIVVTNISTNSIIIDNNNDSNGIQVGVGTGNTTSNLNLYGSFTDGYAIIQAGSTNNNSPNLKIVRSATTNGTIANFQVYSQTSAFIGGSVGIGTTAPSGTLSIVGPGTAGTIRIYPNTPRAETNISFHESSTDGNNLWFIGQGPYSNGTNFCIGQTGFGGPMMVFTTAGNVGIGTNSPGTKLDVSGTARITTSVTTGAVYSTNITSTNIVGTNVSAGVVVASTLLSATGNSNTIGSIVTTGGNVGIGVTAPLEKLHINGNIFLNTAGSLWITGNNDYAPNKLRIHNNNGPTYIDFSGGDIIFRNGAPPSPVATLTANGTLLANYVGIGTSSPETKLDVSGTARITTSVTTGALYSTNQTSTNIVGTNISSGTLNLSTGLTAAGAQLTNANITTSTIATILNTNTISTNITSTNIVATNVSSGTLNLSTGLTSASAQITNLNATTATVSTLLNTNAVSTNVSSGTLNLSTGLTSASAQITNLNATTATVSTLLNTNAVSTNVSSGTLNLSTGLTSATAQITNLNATTATVSTLLNTNAVSTNVSSGTLNLSSGLTAASAQITNENVTTSTIATLRNTNTISTNISSATLNLSTGLTSASAKISNIVVTNISTNSIIIDNNNGSNGIQVGVGTGNTTSNLNLYGSFTDGYAIIQAGSTNNNSPNLKIVRSATTNGTIANFQVYSQTSAFIGGSVGIGTTAPSGTLSIVGPGTAGTIRIYPNIPRTETNIAFHESSTDGSNLWFIGQGPYNNGTNFCIGQTGFGAPMMVFTTAGNVGIGTSAPGEILDVRGNLRIGKSTQGNYISFHGTSGDDPNNYTHTYIGERFYGGTENSELLLFKGNDISGISGPDRIRHLAANHLFDTYTAPLSGTFEGVGISGTTRMLIDQNGNVGVGTTSPAYTLDVSGTGRITTSLTTGAVYSTNITSTNIVATNVSSGTLNLSTGLTAAGAQLTNANITTSTITTLLNTNTISTNITSTNIVATNLSAGTLTLSNVNASNATIASLLTSNQSIVGTLGSFINLPNIEMYGTSDLVNPLYFASAYDSNNIGVGFGAYYNTSGILRMSTTSTSWLLGKSSLGLSIVKCDGTVGSTATQSYRLTIATSGNIGIGTTSPSNTLDVNGIVSVTTSLTTGALYSTNITSTNVVATNLSAGTLALSNVNISNATIASLLTNNQTIIGTLGSFVNLPKLMIYGTSDVNNPLYYFSAYDSNNIGIGFGAYINTAGSVRMSTTSTSWLLGKNANGLSIVKCDGTVGSAATQDYRLHFATSGNVGVGTSTPAYTLDVNGPTRINTTRGVLIGSSTDLDTNRLISALDSGMPGNADRYIAFGKAASVNNQAELAFFNVTTGSSSNYLGLGLHSSRTMVINGAGNVGINTTSPSYTLDVNGTCDVSTSITTAALYSTNLTSTNAVTTNLSAGTLRISNITLGNTGNIRFNNDGSGLIWGSNYSRIYDDAHLRIFTDDQMFFHIGNTTGTAMYIESNSSVGIGTTAPQTKLHVDGTIRSSYGMIVGTLGSLVAYPKLDLFFASNLTHPTISMGAYDSFNNSLNFGTYLNTAGETIMSSSTTAYSIGRVYDVFHLQGYNGTLGSYANTTTAGVLKIKTGNFSINGAGDPFTTLSMNGGTVGNGVIQIISLPNTVNSGRSQDGASFKAWSDGNNILQFFNSAGVIRGFVGGNGASGVTYNTSSDRRLKENVVNMSNSINIVKQMRPVEFTWKSDNRPDYGFIAQEIYDILPNLRPNFASYSHCECTLENISNGVLCECPDHDHDEPVDKESNPLYYGLDYGKITPYLTKALQETIAELEKLRQDFEEYKNTHP